MALTIVVRSAEGKSAPPRITFDAPRIVIGRGPACEVRLPDPSVSHRHASIRQRGADYIVMDEGSTNGTFVGPVRLSPQAPRVLRSGDLVRVGRVWLEAIVEQALPTPNGPSATREVALALIANALAAEGTNCAFRVRVAEGPGAGASFEAKEFDRPYVIGRSKGVDLDLDDPDLSRRHVEIVRRAAGVFVRDLGSKNGSRLGEKPLALEQETAWPKGEPLVIGKSRLDYEDPATEALEELEKAADEQMPAGESVPPPTGADAAAKQRSDPPPASSKRGPPITPRPRRAPEGGESASWTGTDVLVAFLSIVVLALSIAGLVWLMQSG
jgi:pSer/pThr/pTyr-binding forkhead associated (FHA) protein